MSAISTGSPKRPSGVAAFIGPDFSGGLQIFLPISVKTTVGQIALIWMLCGASSVISDLVSAFRPPLDAAWAA